MSRCFVPVTMSSPEFLELDVDGFHVTAARFAPLDRLPPHEHERANIAVMLDGSFELEIAGRTLECAAGTAFTEPLGERHANRIQRGGAHVLVVQPDIERANDLHLDRRLIDDVLHTPRSPATRVARQIAQELRTPDDATPMAVEGLALELLALMTRTVRGQQTARDAPAWLRRAEDLVHADFRKPLRVAQVAHEVGVHPVHLTRVFRRKHRISIGAYVRQLRIEWAADALRHSNASLSQIALRAGFADQSHFSRLFKAHLGITPDRYRRSRTRADG